MDVRDPSSEVSQVFAFFLPSIALLPAGLLAAVGTGIMIRNRRAEEDKKYRELKFQ